MGGRTWSDEEERFYWKVLIPQSPKAVNPINRLHDWKTCAEIMQREMGEKARRTYTKLMLFEHYFQNVKTGHKSPRARHFVVEHKHQLAAAGIEVEETRGSRPYRPRRSKAGTTTPSAPSSETSGSSAAEN